MNLRSRQVWRGDRRRYYADASDDHHRGAPPGERVLRSARRILAGAASKTHDAQRVAPISGLMWNGHGYSSR